MALQAPASTTPKRAFSLEPFAYSEARALMRELGLAEPVAVTLVRRGYRTVGDARAFLDASDVHDPFELGSMAEVVELVREAVRLGQRITVHGDYDCDGVCSTAILVGALRELGADCDWYIPDRLEDGYGLTVSSVDRLAARGTRLLLTADCGIACPDEVAAAREAGMTVVVTDHHEPGDELPGCPILHPRLGSYPFGGLCAAGVAHKLSRALLGAERGERDLDLVALATVADLAPLRGENRALVRSGLALARRSPRPGLRALCAAAGVAPERLDEGDLAFRLGPRINAAGRLYRADAGVELMLTDDVDRAGAIAAELDRANRERRDAEREVLRGAEAARAELPEELAAAPGLVLAGRGWHPGVVGIVASRLAERHFVPVCVVGIDEAGRGRGSARGIPGFDLLAALDSCAGHLARYGGHRAAAGLEIEAGRIDAFRRDFAAHCREVLGEREPVRTEAIDAVVGGESLGHDVAEQFQRLAPFGIGNPGVRLLVPAARVCDVRPMGEEERHARFRLESGARSSLGVAFGVNGELTAAELEDGIDVSVELELNEWNGAVSPRVILGELYPGAPEGPVAEPPYPGEDEWWARVGAEIEAPLEPWPPPELEPDPGGGRRQVADRRGASGVATVAALASTGTAVLVLCADALRRRDLVHRAAAPARFGGGEVAIASGRLADAAVKAAPAAVAAAGPGVVLADWPALARNPGMTRGFEHVVLVDPPPFPYLERIAAGGSGFLHLLWGDAELAMALRVHEEDWPHRAALTSLYRTLCSGCDGEGALRSALQGPGRFPHAPEIAGRRLRVLVELGAVRWERSHAARSVRVVSSEGKDLEQVRCFAAYRARSEEGKRFLSRQRQAR